MLSVNISDKQSENARWKVCFICPKGYDRINMYMTFAEERNFIFL